MSGYSSFHLPSAVYAIHRSAWKECSANFASSEVRFRCELPLSGVLIGLVLLATHLLDPPVLGTPCPPLYARSPWFPCYRIAGWSWSHSDALAWLLPTLEHRRWPRREPRR